MASALVMNGGLAALSQSAAATMRDHIGNGGGGSGGSGFGDHLDTTTLTATILMDAGLMGLGCDLIGGLARAPFPLLLLPSPPGAIPLDTAPALRRGPPLRTVTSNVQPCMPTVSRRRV